jgi:hypothetical protein
MDTVKHLCQKVILLNSGNITLIGRPQEVMQNYLQKKEVLKNTFDLTRCVRPFSNLLTELKIIPQDGKVIHYLEPVSFRIKYSFPKKIINPDFCVLIESLDGHTVFTLISAHQPGNIPRELQGDGEVLCTLPSIPLLTGSYYLSLHLWQPGNQLDLLERLTQIKIEPPNPVTDEAFVWVQSQGMIYVDAAWKITPYNSLLQRDTIQ